MGYHYLHKEPQRLLAPLPLTPSLLMAVTSPLTCPMASTANANRLAYVGKVPGARDSDSWFTPAVYVDSARDALGGIIGLDPFSSDAANEVVDAVTHLTVADDAFATPWAPCLPRNKTLKTVWMNPPYSGKLCRDAVNLFIDQYAAGTFTAGVFLVNNSTETSWFQRAMASATAVCFTNHRIAFWNADGKAQSGNTRGQAFFYFGNNLTAFRNAFTAHGTVVALQEVL
jgi:hypothetical protein